MRKSSGVLKKGRMRAKVFMRPIFWQRVQSSESRLQPETFHHFTLSRLRTTSAAIPASNIIARAGSGTVVKFTPSVLI